PPKEDIRAALEEVAARCEDRGFELREVASGFRFQVRQNLGPWVARLWHERPPKYSRALLETLALIAYRQPITRGEIEEIRGVAVSSNIIKTLHEREWIRVVGHRDVPGRPAMYATTRQFLDYFNLKSLDQLPALAEIRDLETLNAELGFSEPLGGA
ncbi:MAG TPA: SMC-Scp complex subunit ScpB, partial [Halieaceae bacterium]|nr:SMC-Scp complex subunit ScpB [Halieaceae bacterium]